MSKQTNRRSLTAALGVGAIGGAMALSQSASADTPFSSLAFPVTGAPQPRTLPDRLADVINVKEFGAKGDGVSNDGAAIQAALNAAYGAISNPNSNQSQNKGVYIPNGTYLIDQELAIAPIGGSGGAAGAWVFGAGQRNTRLVYTGPNSQMYTPGLTSLVTTMFMNYSRVQGIAFDVTGSRAQCGVYISDKSPGSNGGTGVSWIDCAFIGATSYGLLSSTNGEGSEQLFVNCTFDSCSGTTSTIRDAKGVPVGGGLVLASANALDHAVVGCRFTNNGCGICVPVGGVNLIKGCHFSNNSDIDIWIKQANNPAIVGCYSDSRVFCCAGPTWIAGCNHVPAISGMFFDGTASRFNQDLPLVTIEGCSGGPNSAFKANSGCTLYLRGNTFGASALVTNWTGPVRENI